LEEGYAESLPVADNWADLLISNGVLNLSPNKTAVVDEWARVVKQGGRLQIGDIIVQKELPQSAKDDISLWTG
jgi:ubiquinone/menaquinone biosynthesis C-methylase UbiE